MNRNTEHFPLSLQSSSILSNFRDVGGWFELQNQIRHCKTVCIKRNLYLINYNRMRTQWTTKGNRDAGPSCSCDRGLHRYLRNFGGGGLNPPNHPSRYTTVSHQLIWINVVLQHCVPNFTMQGTCLICVANFCEPSLPISWTFLKKYDSNNLLTAITAIQWSTVTGIV